MLTENRVYVHTRPLKNYAINSLVQKVGQASISATFTNEKKQWFEAILPVMKAKNIIMKAGNNILLRGLQAKAETMSLEAQGNIDIQAAQEYYSQHQRRREIGLRAQVNYDHGGKGLMKPTIGVFGSYASSGNESVKNINAHINVQTFRAKTPNTLTLEGANIVAHDVNIQAHALLMKSLVDTENGRNKSISGGIDLNLATGQLSGHVEGSKGSYTKAKVNEQTGITAIGEFIAEIGDVTHLQGAFIDATNGVLQSKRFIHEDIQEHDQSKQIGFGIGCFDFSRNAAFIMPDVKYASKNQKGVMKAGVSSGVQIVTQSDISNLNRDLKRAREIVKDHKHYVRVIVPIPLRKDSFQSVWDGIRDIFDSAETKIERREAKVYNQIFEDIEERNDLSQAEKVQAFQAATDMFNKVKELNNDLYALDDKINEKLEGLELPDNDDFVQEPKNEFNPLYLSVNSKDKTMQIEHGHQENSIAQSASVDEDDLPIVNIGVFPVYGYKLGILHDVGKKIRHVQDAYEDFKESQPTWLRNTLSAAMGVAGFCAGGPLKKIGQKLAAIAVAEGIQTGADDLLHAINCSGSERIVALEQSLGIARKDTLTFAGLFLGVAIYKATPGISSKAAIKAQEAKIRNKDKAANDNIKPKKVRAKKEKSVKPKKELLIKEGFLNEKSVAFSKYWKKSVEFKGKKVYQRDDLIDPKKVDRYGVTNLQNMKDGLAPIGPDGNKINLHHMLQSDKGAIAEVTQGFHQKYTSVIHINDPQKTKSGIDRPVFRDWKRKYWENRAKDFE